jgi:hypothetical protein
MTSHDTDEHEDADSENAEVKDDEDEEEEIDQDQDSYEEETEIESNLTFQHPPPEFEYTPDLTARLPFILSPSSPGPGLGILSSPFQLLRQLIAFSTAVRSRITAHIRIR